MTKPKAVLPRVFGTRLVSGSGIINSCDKNDRFWRIGIGNRFVSEMRTTSHNASDEAVN